MFNNFKNNVVAAFGGLQKFEDLGDILQHALPLVALISVMLLAPGSVVPWVVAFVVAMLVAHAMKWAFNFTPWGTRPNGGEDSFPSGHTASAFAGAWIIVAVFGWGWGAIPLALAAATGMSRVVSDNHHWRDVGASAVLAGVVIYMFRDGVLPMSVAKLFSSFF